MLRIDTEVFLVCLPNDADGLQSRIVDTYTTMMYTESPALQRNLDGTPENSDDGPKIKTCSIAHCILNHDLRGLNQRSPDLNVVSRPHSCFSMNLYRFF